jgi:telomerase reverse transcriptase
MLYFRQDDWDTLCAPLIERLKAATFEKLSEVELISFFRHHSDTRPPQTEAQEILRQRELGFSFVRLLPKETGVRPIINLRRKQNVRVASDVQKRLTDETLKASSRSINQVLQITFDLLTYEKVHHMLSLLITRLIIVMTEIKTRVNWSFRLGLGRNPRQTYALQVAART